MTIFIAEDNPADVYLLRIAFAQAYQESIELIVASDGEAAMDFIENKSHLSDGAKPDLIILDLNLPKSDGEDVLRLIRRQADYNCVPVVVLTSSDSPRDREAAALLGANCYLTKPCDLEAFIGLGATLLSYVRRPNDMCSGAVAC